MPYTTKVYIEGNDTAPVYDIFWQCGEKSGIYRIPENIICGNNEYEILWMWAEGNFSCDCNRSVLFGISDKNFPCGDSIKIKRIARVLIEDEDNIQL